MSLPQRIARHVFLSGKVQGVWFRAWAEQQATQLGLDGWVRNRKDGRVEAVIAGQEIAVREMLRRLKVGPPAARVDDLEEKPWSGEVKPGFKQADSV
jgi:acylphosphatase